MMTLQKIIRNLLHPLQNQIGSWGDLASIAASAAAGFLSGDDDGGGDRTTTSIQPIQESTDTKAQINDFDILYSGPALESMNKFADDLASFSAGQRDFLTNTYLPYQQSIVQANTPLLSTIERIAPEALETIATDMASNETLKKFLSGKIEAGDEGFKTAIDNFNTELKNLPTEQELVGQALASVEKEFGQAGKNLVRDFQSRGQTVSEASKRDLEFQKAQARSGASAAAKEASRKERLNAAQLGVGVNLQAAQAGATTRAQDVSSLNLLQQQTKLGLETPQVGGVSPADGGVGAASVEAGVRTAAGTQNFGTRQRSDTVSQVQKGIKEPTLTSGASGVAPSGAASLNAAGAPAPTPATGDGSDGALLGEGTTGGVTSDTRDIGAGLGGALKDALAGVGINPQ
jgi:hypothetical protein